MFLSSEKLKLRRVSKILCIGDQHVRMTGSFLPFNTISNNGLTYELNNFLGGYKFVHDLILLEKPDLVVNLGDIFHNYDLVPVEAINAAGIGMSMIRKAVESIPGCHQMMIQGNHDVTSTNCNITSLTPFENNVTTIVSEVMASSLGGRSLTFIPYCEDEYLYQYYMENRDTDIIFMHNEVPGAMYESGKISDSRVNVPDKPVIVDGHIHLSQILDNVFIPGSLVQNRFNRKKIDTYGICILDTDKMVPKMIRNTGSRHYILLYNSEEVLSYNPKEVVIKLLSDEDRDEVAEKLKGYKYQQMKPPKNEEDRRVIYSEVERHSPEDLLRVFVRGDRESAVDILESIIGGEK